jgi:hypothetical protein
MSVEGAITIAQKYEDLSTICNIYNHQVQFAVAFEVSHRCITWTASNICWTTAWLRAVWNVPFAFPSRTAMLFVAYCVTAKSNLPSPLKSPTATNVTMLSLGRGGCCD